MSGSFKCLKCDLTFTRADTRFRHNYTCQTDNRFPCTNCQKGFTRKDTLARHLKTCQIALDLKSNGHQNIKRVSSSSRPVFKRKLEASSNNIVNTPAEILSLPDEDGENKETKMCTEDDDVPSDSEASNDPTETSAAVSVGPEVVREFIENEAEDEPSEDQTPLFERVNDYVQIYLTKLVNYDNRGLDTIYGVKFNGDDYVLGDTIVEFNNNFIDVDNVKFKCTPGLTELLFSCNPNMNIVMESDLRKYECLLNITHAHKKNFSAQGDIIREISSPKYNFVISVLFPSLCAEGLDLRPSCVQEFDLRDPNELVNELRRMIPYKEKYHREIQYIENLLREGGIIL